MYTAFAILAVIALAVQGLILFLAFFGPDLPYDVKTAPDFPLASREFANLLATLTDAQLHPGNRIEVLTDGPCFYQAELEAIASARHTINLEAVCDSAIAARTLKGTLARAKKSLTTTGANTDDIASTNGLAR